MPGIAVPDQQSEKDKGRLVKLVSVQDRSNTNSAEKEVERRISTGLYNRRQLRRSERLRLMAAGLVRSSMNEEGKPQTSERVQKVHRCTRAQLHRRNRMNEKKREEHSSLNTVEGEHSRWKKER